MSGSAVALVAGGDGFGQQLADHVGSRAFFGVSHLVDALERFGCESQRYLGAWVSVRHAETVSHWVANCHALGYSCVMTTTTAPARIARHIDAAHTQLRVEVTNLLAIAETCITQGDAAAARDCLTQVADRQACIAAIEACWVAAA